MSRSQPSSNFQNAAAYLSSASSLSQVSTSVKLELYGLFKYLTSSRQPATSRPSIWDMSGRAKWDAWDAASKMYEHPNDAEKRYLEMARSLGWTEEAVVESKQTAKVSDDENIWDDDDHASGTSSGEAGGGMGFSVSRMAPPPKVVDKTIHGLALSNDVSGLTSLLDTFSDTDLNALDEFGYAPIHLACDRGHVDIVKLLVARGADRNIKDPDNLTPLELSQEAGNTEIENILTSIS